MRIKWRKFHLKYSINKWSIRPFISRFLSQDSSFLLLSRALPFLPKHVEWARFIWSGACYKSSSICWVYSVRLYAIHLYTSVVPKFGALAKYSVWKWKCQAYATYRKYLSSSIESISSENISFMLCHGVCARSLRFISDVFYRLVGFLCNQNWLPTE